MQTAFYVIDRRSGLVRKTKLGEHYDARSAAVWRAGCPGFVTPGKTELVDPATHVTLDLTDDEARGLAKHLRQAIDYDPYPLGPRPDPLKAILAKLEPPAPKPEPLPPLKPGRGPSVGRGRSRR